MLTRSNDEFAKWKPAYDEVHVDEKWFFLSETTYRYYITASEKEEKVPASRCKHKSHILKVMFLCATARPQFDNNRVCKFDGKLGIWPFVHKVQAQRSSVNRPKGTWETKTLNITKEVYRDFIIGKVLPAIYEKFPRNRSRQQVVSIQQDNPNTHFREDDEEWQAAVSCHPCFKVQLKQQPPNSPDTNILDLGFFRAIQSLQWKQPPARTIDALIANVDKAFSIYDPNLLEKIWLTHQGICDNILVHDGDNDFDPPHMAKDSIKNRDGKLPASFILSESARAALSNTEQL